MKCLSLWQPWASLLVGGAKKVETRGWRLRHRGRLLIHAATKWNADLSGILRSEPFASAWLSMGLEFPVRGGFVSPSVPLGMVVGHVDVIECYPKKDVTVDPFDEPDHPCQVIDGKDRPGLMIGPTEEAFGDYSPGRFAILCENPVRYERPFAFRGRQGLFEVPDSLLEGCGQAAP